MIQRSFSDSSSLFNFFLLFDNWLNGFNLIDNYYILDVTVCFLLSQFFFFPARNDFFLLIIFFIRFHIFDSIRSLKSITFYKLSFMTFHFHSYCFIDFIIFKITCFALNTRFIIHTRYWILNLLFSALLSFLLWINPLSFWFLNE